MKKLCQTLSNAIVVAALASIISCGGGGGSSSSSSNPTSTQTILQAPTFRQEFTGNNATVLPSVNLPKGVYKITVTTEGYFQLFTVTGMTVFNLSSGEANGAEAIFYSSGRDVVFETDNVSYDWNLVIESIDFSNPQPIENINSLGQYSTPKVLGPYKVDTGATYKFTMFTDGYFILRPFDPYIGDYRSTMFNESSGHYGAQTTAQFSSEIRLFETDNISGLWSLTVEKM